MKNRITESISSINELLFNRGRNEKEPIVHIELRHYTTKIKKNIKSLDRLMLTFTEINLMIMLIDTIRSLDGYHNEFSDEMLDKVYKKLQKLSDITVLSKYEKRINSW